MRTVDSIHSCQWVKESALLNTQSDTSNTNCQGGPVRGVLTKVESIRCGEAAYLDQGMAHPRLYVVFYWPRRSPLSPPPPLAGRYRVCHGRICHGRIARHSHDLLSGARKSDAKPVLCVCVCVQPCVCVCVCVYIYIYIFNIYIYIYI